MEIKTPPASYYLKKAAKLASGAKTPSREVAGYVTAAQVREIAEVKNARLECERRRRLPCRLFLDPLGLWVLR